jgi:polyhydroxybutyrate depolymerase
MLATLLVLSIVGADPIVPGDQVRSIEVNGVERKYSVHAPPQYDRQRPTPVVLIYHGALTNGDMVSAFTGLNKKADEAGFLAVYPNGNGNGKRTFVWNSGGLRSKAVDQKYDDVAFTSALLDDLATIANVDARRIYATGLSNGGMMCYRLAAELSDRIAAIAPVAGTMSISDAKPHRPVSVLHFHGTVDKLVPYTGADERARLIIPFKSVDETMHIWAKINGCPETPAVAEIPDIADDGTTVERKTWGPGTDGSEVVLYVVVGGGHTWPGRERPVRLLGKATRDISANDLIWDFFQKHPMPQAGQ